MSLQGLLYYNETICKLLGNYKQILVIYVYIFAQISLLDVGNRQHFFVAVSSRGSHVSSVKFVLSEDALLGTGFYSAAASNATYVLGTRGFCREMIHFIKVW